LKSHYPELERHKAEHQKLKKTIEMIQGFHSSGRYHLAADMFLELMKSWLIDHILNEDKEALSFNG
jgi:hemerythrin-like metal-binding protein